MSTIRIRGGTAWTVTAALACLAALGVYLVTPAAAQGKIVLLSALTWYGPAGITEDQVFRFNYSNFGTHDVEAAWATSSAINGQVVDGDITRFRKVAPGAGLTWDTHGKEVRAREK